jgi:hypothetical protein
VTKNKSVANEYLKKDNSRRSKMIISDLNHIQSVEGSELVGGTGTTIGFNLNDRKDIVSRVDISGNTAVVDGLAQAFGDDTVAQVINRTVTTPGASVASGISISATGGGKPAPAPAPKH